LRRHFVDATIVKRVAAANSKSAEQQAFDDAMVFQTTYGIVRAARIKPACLPTHTACILKDFD
jgi:hypothetical protein